MLGLLIDIWLPYYVKEYLWLFQETFQGWRPVGSYSGICSIQVHPSPLMSPYEMTSKTIFLAQIVTRVNNYPFLIGETHLHLALDEKPGFPLARIWRVLKRQVLHPGVKLFIPLIYTGQLGETRGGLQLCQKPNSILLTNVQWGSRLLQESAHSLYDLHRWNHFNSGFLIYELKISWILLIVLITFCLITSSLVPR